MATRCRCPPDSVCVALCMNSLRFTSSSAASTADATWLSGSLYLGGQQYQYQHHRQQKQKQQEIADGWWFVECADNLLQAGWVMMTVSDSLSTHAATHTTLTGGPHAPSTVHMHTQTHSIHAPAQPERHISCYCRHDHLVVRVLEHKPRGLICLHAAAVRV